MDYLLHVCLKNTGNGEMQKTKPAIAPSFYRNGPLTLAEHQKANL